MRILVIFGTRPEAVKFAPLIPALADAGFDVRVCNTGQHDAMVRQVVDFFDLPVHHDLRLMRPGQGLFDLTARLLGALEPVFADVKPDLAFVQGDTTTVLAGSLAAFYTRTPLAHLEAGLRSGDLAAPFPEEGNRLLAGRLARLHFAATERARENLALEGITEGVHVVGNTVIDALLATHERVSADPARYDAAFPFLRTGAPLVLVTGHRRESFGRPFLDLCLGLRRIAEAHPEADLVYPVHLNPNVLKPVRESLSGLPNAHLIDPLDYPHLVRLMGRARVVLTDSGGIQEEAPSLGAPVLVMREKTERPEGIEAGNAKLVGTDPDLIFGETHRLINDDGAHAAMSRAANPYGDGRASERIAAILKTWRAT